MRKLLHAEILNERLRPEESMRAERFPVKLMLHNVRSLYNVGSLFRTCDSAFAEELILCGFTPHPPRKEIEKTALGAVDSVPWRYEKDIKSAIREEKNRGYKIIALELTDKKRPYDTLKAEEYPLCIVAGNELSGIEDEILELGDDAIEIPMFGVKHSLNVSVAAGIALYEAIRKWREEKE
ncbi:MAG: RNA methyltransferase [Bacteroidota bacterium]